MSMDLPGQKFLYRPSGQIGVFYNFHLGSSSSMGTELLLLQIEGKSKYKKVSGDSYDVLRHLTYVGLPIYYGYKVKKIECNLGFQFNYLLRGKEQNGNFGNETYKANIDKFDYGVRGGIIYDYSNKFEIEGNYYFGINNIWADTYHKGNWKVRQLTVGLRYKFLPRE
jgi:hypothetical protein